MFNLILGPQRYDFFLVIGSSAGENAILFWQLYKSGRRLGEISHGAPSCLWNVSEAYLLGFGDEFDFYEGSLGEILDSKRTACGEGCSKELGVHLVHGPEIGDLAQEDGSLHHIVEIETFALQDGAGVKQALLGLFFDTSLRKCAGLGDDGQLARYEDEIAGADSLAVGTDGGGSLVSV